MKDRETKRERHKREKEERRRRHRWRSHSGGEAESSERTKWESNHYDSDERSRKRRSQSAGHRKKKCRRHRKRTPSPELKLKEEPRDSIARGRERSRWENGSVSPQGRNERGGSMLRAIKGEGGSEEIVWGEKRNPTGVSATNKPPLENKAKPDFGLSGKLAQDTNTFNGVVIKYSEPADARKPKRRWRLYPFKGDVGLATLYVHRQSAYLIGRDRKVVDLPVDHPSCSKQHAVLQYRAVPRANAPGLRLVPYIIDLESANGTYVNNVQIEARKFVELFEKDVIKFAYSSREYVLLHEHSKDDDADDNVQE